MPIKTLDQALKGKMQGGDGMQKHMEEMSGMIDHLESMMADPAMVKMMNEQGMGDRLKQLASMMTEPEPSEDDLTWEDTRETATEKMKKKGV